MNNLLKKQMKDLFADRVIFDMSAKEFTTFKTGGEVSAVVFPKTKNEIDFLFDLYKNGIPVRFLGCGSNVLVSDEGFNGIIAITKHFSNIKRSNSLLEIASGTKISDLLKFCIEHNIQGLEFLAGIPGTIGGCVIVNAGTNNTSAGQIVNSVLVLDKNGIWREKTKKEINWAYRHSDLKNDVFFLASARVFAEKGRKEAIKQKINCAIKKRRRDQPLGYPSAGCVFKNPPGFFAGMLIEKAGLKGFRVGEAEISPKHANFIVNRGKARSLDIWKIIIHIQNIIKKTYNIEMELEIEPIGRFT